MGLSVNSLDLVDPGVRTLEQALRAKGDQLILRYWGMSNGVAQMVNDVLGLVCASKLTVLRLWSHGMPGGQGVSTGLPGVSPAGQRAGISRDNFYQVESDLIRLKPYFEPKGRIELRGCSVGAGSSGMSLLEKLAKTLNVEAHAAMDAQPIGPLDWVGPVVKVMPNGRSSHTSGIPIK